MRGGGFLILLPSLFHLGLLAGEPVRLVPEVPHAGDLFGWSVAISGDLAVVGAPGFDGAGTDSGTAYVFHRTTSGWAQEARLEAPAGKAYDAFGFSVAVSGDTVAVGGWMADGVGENSGCVYLFTRTAGVWGCRQVLSPGDGKAEDRFGFSLGLHGDRLVVGAYRADAPEPDSGAAYVFRRRSAGWQQEARLVSGDPALGDGFGSSVSVHGDRVAVGAMYDDHAGTDAGRVTLFCRQPDRWAEETRLTAPQAGAGDLLGRAVVLRDDLLLAGAFLADPAGSGSGRVLSATRSTSNWSVFSDLAPVEPKAGDGFGYALALAGRTAVIGVWKDDAAGLDRGSIQIATNDGTAWGPLQRVIPAELADGDSCGWSVAASGGWALAGAPRQDGRGVDAGAVWALPITDSATPRLTGVMVRSPDGRYSPDDHIELSLVFSEPVVLAGGSLSLRLSSGASLVVTPEAVDWPTEVMPVTYTVKAGERCAILDLLALQLGPAATLCDPAGKPVALALPVAANLADHAAVSVGQLNRTVRLAVTKQGSKCSWPLKGQQVGTVYEGELTDPCIDGQTKTGETIDLGVDKAFDLELTWPSTPAGTG